MPVRFKPLLALVAVALLSIGHAADPGPAERLAALAQRYFDARMDLDPVSASATKPDPRHEGRLAITIAPQQLARARALYAGVLRELQAIPLDALAPAERLNHRLLREEAELLLEGLQYPAHRMPIDQYGAVPLMLAGLGTGDQQQPLKTTADYGHYLQRLRRLPAWNQQAISNLREGMRLGQTVPRALIDSALPIFRALAERDFGKSQFGTAVRGLPNGFSSADKARIAGAYRRAFEREIQPSMVTLLRFLETEYRPACRSSSGLADLPGGAAWYAYLVRLHTTTALAPQAIHELGLAEVARIRGEMARVQQRMGFEGTVTAFLQWHAAEPRFQPFKSAEDMLARYRDLNQRLAQQLPQLFGRQPAIPLEVREIPELLRATGTSYYQPGTLDGRQPGVFYAWSADPRKMNDSIVTTLFLHEGQPGHHYQAATQQALPLPDFRKYGWISAYGEGWALYAETLGRELGLYEDPNQYLGHLKLELLRAVRLVTDTGLHAMGWTREQSMRYMMDAEGASEADARNATERYMAWPGQALAYKVGSLRLQALRERATQALADRFSLRDFHDLVLSQGNVPLSELDRLVDEWIRSRQPR
jgi:uncharacterized protein (DUF885 family)